MRKLIFRTLVCAAGLLFTMSVNGQNDASSVLELSKKNAKQLRIATDDAVNMKVSSFHRDEQSGILYVYLQQQFHSIKVHNSIISVAFNKSNELIYSSGGFMQNIAVKAGQRQQSFAADRAVTVAANELKLAAPSGLQTRENRFTTEKRIIFSEGGISKRNIETELFWLPTEDGKSVQLAWNVNIDVLNSSDWWNVFIDATTGKYITKYNWTVHDNFGISAIKKPTDYLTKPGPVFFQEPVEQKSFTGGMPNPPNVTSANYKVIPFPRESPSHSAPTVVNNPWELAGAGNNATTHGWHFDGTINYDITRGNNVFAYLDVNPVNSPNAATNWPDTSTSPAPALTFSNTPNFSTTPRDVSNRKFALDNLFYWNNMMHDVSYQYGFTEVAGNFQKDNLGRGGLGNDWVNAQAQDGAGTDNANFAVPNDGVNGRMRMYLFTGGSFLSVTAPSSIAGSYNALEGAFSNSNLLKNINPVSGQVVYFNDATGSTHEACGVGGLPVNTIAGKIALINRGTCAFTEKVKNAQDAGAIGVIMVNNVAGAPLIMGGTDNTITIPAVMITQADGAIISSQLANGVNVTISEGGRDGDLDNGIVCHEYGHGISIRLTGGPANSACLTNAEQGGEGWSDFFGLMMTTNWLAATVNDGPTARPVGTYAVSQAVNGSGIRRYPYSTNMSVNPLTYANLAASTEVHDIGEIWCAALWDMTWNIIQQQNTITSNLYNSNGNGGNVIAMNLVMMGLKLQPCGPGFLDSRDAILAADSILYNSVHKCAIWNAFARRGMGVSAIQGSSNNATDQTAAFDVPQGLSLSNTMPSSVTSGTSFTLTTKAQCGCQPLTGYVIRDTVPAGFTVVSGTPGGTLNGNVYSFPAANFTTQEIKNFSVTLRADLPGSAIDSVINDNRDGSTIGNFRSSISGTGGGWSNSSLKAHAGTSSWLGAEPATISSSSLTSASSASAAGQNLSLISFWHYYNTEKTYDGGVIEYSTDAINWNDASPFFLKGSYSALMDTSTVLKNRRAFTGTNGGFSQSILNMSFMGTTPYALRFRMTTDEGTQGEGWFVDDIVRVNGNGGIFKTAVYSTANSPLDSIITPLFVKSVPSDIVINGQPVNATICAGTNTGFTVTATSTSALSYQWQISINGGSIFSDINGQTGATLSITNATADMNGYLFRCIVRDVSSFVYSAAAKLTVNTTPVVSTQPVDKTICAGANVAFTVAATGATSYQWQQSTDGTTFTNIDGASSASLSFAGTMAQHNYKYRCQIINSCGTSISNVVTLTVVNAAITSSPVNITRCAGERADFVVTAIGATAYQWQLSTNGGAAFTNINGASFASLSLPAITAAMTNNQYRCIITTGCGQLTSSVATLVVNSTTLTIADLPAKICATDASIQLIATPAGGSWSGNAINGNNFNPTIAGVGDHLLTYNYTPASNCTVTSTVTARVQDCVDRNISLANNGVQIYPNPNKGEFTIRMNSNLYKQLFIRIFNSTGQLVHEEQFNNLSYGSLVPVNIKNAADGLYIVKVYADANTVNESKAFKLFVHH